LGAKMDLIMTELYPFRTFPCDSWDGSTLLLGSALLFLLALRITRQMNGRCEPVE